MSRGNRTRRLAARYSIDVAGLDRRQARRKLRRLASVYAVTPWANPNHDVLGDLRAVWANMPRAHDRLIDSLLHPAEDASP